MSEFNWEDLTREAARAVQGRQRHDAEDVLDVAQQAVMVFFEKYVLTERFDPNQGTAKGLVRKIAVRLNQRRRRGMARYSNLLVAIFQHSASRHTSATNTDLFAIFLETDACRAIRRAVKRLKSWKQQRAYLMHLRKRCNTSIATKMGATNEQVSTWLSRARKTLQDDPQLRVDLGISSDPLPPLVAPAPSHDPRCRDTA